MRLFVVAGLVAALLACVAAAAEPGAPAAVPFLTATEKVGETPRWAALQRELFDALAEGADVFVERYTHEDGRHRYNTWGKYDDSFEPFHNWPTVYAMGGDARLLRYAQRQFDATFPHYPDPGRFKDEFPTQDDWAVHLGEGYHLFYTLCLADPAHEANRARARRYAGFYLGPNYDTERKLIRWPRNGSVVPQEWTPDGAGDYVWTIEHYGLPFYDIDGVERYEDLQKPGNMKKLAEATHVRWTRGDVAGNLTAASLMLNAYLLEGERRYAEWVIGYVDAWRRRITENKGILPDNVGPSGIIGEHLGGRWFGGGGNGWTFPHGWGTLGQSVGIAAESAVLITGNLGYLDMPRSQIDLLLGLAIERNGTRYVPHKHGEPGRVRNTPFGWLPVLRKEGGIDKGEALEVDGWFKFMPMDPVHTAHLWNLSQSEDDYRRAVAIRNHDGTARWSRDWERIEDIKRFMAKDHGGHEAAWIAWLAGDYPAFPVDILTYSLAESRRRTEDNRRHQPGEGERFNLIYRNPVLAEALVNLTLGGPLPFYNGGLLMARVRYFDGRAQRPGLPPDVAALVTGLAKERTVVELVNIGAVETREVLVQAGVYGEHRFGEAVFREQGDVPAEPRRVAVNGKHLRVVLPPRTRVSLELETARFVHSPSYAPPNQRPEALAKPPQVRLPDPAYQM